MKPDAYSTSQREVKHHPGETTIPREDIRRAVCDVVYNSTENRSMKLNTINVPRELMLGGKVFRIVTDSELAHREGANGDIHWERGIIRLQPALEGVQNAGDDIERVFFHELVHGILLAMGKRTQAGDEEFVEGFANCLHQALKTAKYD